MEDRSHIVIAIDGPAASGKSSVARELARRLGFVYVNSGGMYRAITWYLLQRHVDPCNQSAVEREVSNLQLRCDVQNGRSRVLINDFDPKDHLNDDDVNQHVSIVSSVPQVRSVPVQKMRDQAREHDLVIEGRDIGSVVFPDTPFKFYIDASPEIRSQRRAAQGQKDQIEVRDRVDSSRQNSPLIVAKDDEVIDSTNLSIDQVVDEIVTSLRRKGLAE